MKIMLRSAACLLIFWVTGELCSPEPASLSDHGAAAATGPERLGIDVPPPALPSLWQQIQHGLTVNMANVRQLKKAERLRDLPRELEDHRVVSFLPRASLPEGKLTAEGELAYHATETSAGLGDSRQRLLRFGLSGAEGPFRYGASFRIAGTGFTSLQDQANREVCGEWQWGLARFRSSLSETWNNLENDPRRPRLTQAQGRLALTIAPPSWPELNLSYARSTSSTSLEPNASAAHRSESETLEAALSHGGATWSSRLSTLYSITTDRLHPGVETVGQSYGWSGTYRPTSALTIGPSLTLREDLQRWTGVRLDTPSASLSVSYVPDPVINLSAFGSYSHSQSSDNLVDSTSYKAKTVLSWTSESRSWLRQTLLFEAGYANALDAVHARVTEELSGLVRLQLAGR